MVLEKVFRIIYGVYLLFLCSVDMKQSHGKSYQSEVWDENGSHGDDTTTDDHGWLC